MKVETAQIIEAASPQGWSQVHRFFPEEKEKKEARGALVAVINLTGLTPSVGVTLAGREVIARIHEEYYGDLTQTPFVQLKQAVTRVYQEISQEAKIEIIAAALVDQVIYLALAGPGKVLLQREEQTSSILTGSSGAELIRAASGYLKPNDLVLLATSCFFTLVAQGVVQAALQTGSAATAAEMLRPVVLGQEEDSLAAACLLQPEAETEMAPSTEAEPEVTAPPLPKSRPALKLPSFQLRLSWRQTTQLFKRLKHKTFQGLKQLIRPGGKPRRSSKSLFLVALILAVILTISLIFGRQQRQEKASQKKIIEVLSLVQGKKEEAEAILSLNQEKAKELLEEAEQIIAGSGQEIQTAPELVAFSQELQKLKDSVWRDYQVSLEVFFDLELIKKGAQASRVALVDNQLFIFDQTNLTVYQLGIKDKKTAVIAAGDQLEKASQITAIDNNVYFLTPEGILKASGQSKTIDSLVEEDLENESPLALSAFGSNLYWLDTQTIWFYPGTETGFGARRNWLKEELSLGEPVTMAIDGSIWVLQQSGQVLKLTRGVSDSFRLSGWDEALPQPTDLFTNADVEKLYLLDQSAQKVIVFLKSGEYDASYHWGESIKPSQLIVDEEEGKTLLVSGSKIYQVALK